jgi:hypothetical protein
LNDVVGEHLALLTTPVEIAAGKLGNRAGLVRVPAIGIHNPLFTSSVSLRLLSLPAVWSCGLGFES